MRAPDNARRGSFTMLLGIALGLLLPSTASAHRSSAYYEVRWRIVPAAASVHGAVDGVLDWAFVPSYPSEARADALAATEAWNLHAGGLTFRNAPDLVSERRPDECDTEPVNYLRQGAVDGPSSSQDGTGGILAYAALCVVPGTDIAYFFSVTQDEAEPWHLGPPPVPFDRFDLQGILTHEFGHATGWTRHFLQSEGPECIERLRHTMCATVAPGTADPRDLEPHDIDTWQDAY